MRIRFWLVGLLLVEGGDLRSDSDSAAIELAEALSTVSRDSRVAFFMMVRLGFGERRRLTRFGDSLFRRFFNFLTRCELARQIGDAFRGSGREGLGDSLFATTSATAASTTATASSGSSTRTRAC